MLPQNKFGLKHKIQSTRNIRKKVTGSSRNTDASSCGGGGGGGYHDRPVGYRQKERELECLTGISPVAHGIMKTPVKVVLQHPLQQNKFGPKHKIQSTRNISTKVTGSSRNKDAPSNGSGGGGGG